MRAAHAGACKTVQRRTLDYMGMGLVALNQITLCCRIIAGSQAVHITGDCMVRYSIHATVTPDNKTKPCLKMKKLSKGRRLKTVQYSLQAGHI